MSRELNLPSSWSSMGIDAKAAYLVQTHQAKNYAAACSLLNKMRRPKPVPRPVAIPRLPYADSA